MTDLTNNDAEVLVERRGALGILTLNRPRALNSLTLGMVRIIDAALDDFAADPAIAAVLLQGAGDRGLCAGGDIRMVHDSGKAGDGMGEMFWREEYRLNARIAHYAKPYIAVMDGITMGGGVGLSAHGSHRVATERLRLAMPETGIGFFPDVGATWLLAHAPGELGTYLGLTGAIVGAADAILANLADVAVESTRLPELIAALAALDAGADAEAVTKVIAEHRFETSAPPLAAHRSVIDRAFAHDTVEAIFEALAGEGGDFAAQTLQTLKSKSPTALNIALRMLREARASQDLETCLNREFAGAAMILTLADFYEGVRAAVIDKDRNPRWSPASLAEVTASDIQRFFRPHKAPPFGAI
jgi:enoyl-CoA hydratase